MENENKKAAKDIIGSVLKSMVLKGLIDIEELNERELLLEKIRELLPTLDIAIIVDHRPDILKQADWYYSQKEYNYAILFYTIFFEHSINNVIIVKLQNLKISEKSRKEILRSLSIATKFGWFLEVVGLPKFNEKYKKTITRLSEERNTFVHYKWNPDIDDTTTNTPKSEVDLGEIKACVKYMKNYESKNLFFGNKSSVDKAIRLL